MRYVTVGFLSAVGAIFLAAGAVAQTPSTTTSTGAPPDFAASANARLNSYRAMAKLPPVVDDPVMSAAAYDHARYLVKNGIGSGDVLLQKQQLRFRIQTDAARSEIKGKPFYTDEGAAAAMNAVNLTAPEINLSGAEFVDLAMTMPFHGLIPMNPQFALVGLGAYCDPGQCAIVIPGHYGLEKSVRIALYDGPASDRLWNPGLGLIPAETGRLKSPVEFPPDGATVVLNSYSGHDYPDPLPSCPEYKAPTGAPISIQLGEGYGPDGSLEVSSHLVSREGVEIETCLVTAASYNGRDALETKIGKTGLTLIGAAIILPREPLAAGHYKVALKEAEKLYEWSFTVAAPATPAQSATR
jgi:uncharacterized protein YkwD